jgi:hypothetical protein
MTLTENPSAAAIESTIQQWIKALKKGPWTRVKAARW